MSLVSGLCHYLGPHQSHLSLVLPMPACFYNSLFFKLNKLCNLVKKDAGNG